MKYLSKDLIFTHVIIIYKGYYYVDIHQKRIRKRLVIDLKISKSKTIIQYIHKGEVNYSALGSRYPYLYNMYTEEK